jgi:hypothetical protein
MNLTEIIGYSASVLLIASFMFKDIRKLRILNSFACVLFVAYGALLDNNWPIIITNVFICGVNIYYLLRTERNKLAEN